MGKEQVTKEKQYLTRGTETEEKNREKKQVQEKKEIQVKNDCGQ